MIEMHEPAPRHAGQVAIGLGALGVAAVLAVGAWNIPSAAGYSGVGPDFLPWVMSAAMAVCGTLLVWQALKKNNWTPALLTGKAFEDFVDRDFSTLRATMVRAGMV